MGYLNTLPLLYGLRKSALPIQLIPDYPARVAGQLLNGEIDLGLVPVAVIPRLKEAHIVGDYCIGCNGPVASVALFSEKPMEAIEQVCLDYQSRTSASLLRILLKDYWKKEVEYLPPDEDFRSLIHGSTAGLVIGDRAFEQARLSPVQYDLGQAWKDFTGRPFVFAAWVSNKELPQDFIEAFNRACGMGFAHLDEIVAENPFPPYDLKKYYTENISYRLDEEKKAAMQLFLSMLEPAAI